MKDANEVEIAKKAKNHEEGKIPEKFMNCITYYMLFIVSL